jgi:tocopherol O-methyltransferase
MVSYPLVEKRHIRGHYDLATPFYRLLWGPHIHHGYWEASESPRRAQVQLIERLATLAGISSGNYLLDVGCGMGGSSIHLAKTRGCRALGLTISPLQRYWAAASARCRGAGRHTRFRCADAEHVDLPPHAFDVVWSVECTEHLFDKRAFFARAAAWLKPAGSMAICAWLAGDSLDEARSRQVYDVCQGFFCPSLGSRQDYVDWMTSAGLRVTVAEDWTERVAKTWEICRQRVARSRVRALAALIDRHSVLFLDRFDTILSAYRSGAMKYGCFIAKKAH